MFFRQKDLKNKNYRRAKESEKEDNCCLSILINKRGKMQRDLKIQKELVEEVIPQMCSL